MLVLHYIQNGTTHTFRLPCTYSSVEERVLEDAGSKAMWGLNIMSRNTDVLATKIAAAIEAKKGLPVLSVVGCQTFDLCLRDSDFGLSVYSGVRSMASLCVLGRDTFG